MDNRPGSPAKLQDISFEIEKVRNQTALPRNPNESITSVITQQPKSNNLLQITSDKIFGALNKVLVKEKDNLLKVNFKIEELNKRHQELTKLLVVQTQKKNEIMKNINSGESYNNDSLEPTLSKEADIDEFITQLKQEKLNLLDQCEGVKSKINEIEEEMNKYMHKAHNKDQRLSTEKNAVDNNPEVKRYRQGITELENKTTILRNNLKTLKEKLNQTEEQLAMTKEDLMSKLLQRADFVAQREELDEMYESTLQAYGVDFLNYCVLQQYGDPKFKSDVKKQLKLFAMIKDPISESSSDIDISMSTPNRTPNYKKMKSLVKRHVKNQRKQNYNINTVYADKCSRVLEIYYEIERFESNIHQNYKYVDNTIIPQLKSLSSAAKNYKKKYSKLNKIVEKYTEEHNRLSQKLQQTIDKIKVKFRYKNDSATSLYNEHYQIQPDRNEYFQESPDRTLENLQVQYRDL